MELHHVWKTSPEILSQFAALSGKSHINARVVEGWIQTDQGNSEAVMCLQDQRIWAYFEGITRFVFLDRIP
jgi:hypothetical protein